MLRIIVIVLLVAGIIVGFIFANEYGQLAEVNFRQAVQKTETQLEGDQAPKVIVLSVIHKFNAGMMECTDNSGNNFNVEYTGSEPEKPFTKGMTVRFVGHVHGGAKPYFHAMQVYLP